MAVPAAGIKEICEAWVLAAARTRTLLPLVWNPPSACAAPEGRITAAATPTTTPTWTSTEIIRRGRPARSRLIARFTVTADASPATATVFSRTAPRIRLILPNSFHSVRWDEVVLDEVLVVLPFDSSRTPVLQLMNAVCRLLRRWQK